LIKRDTAWSEPKKGRLFWGYLLSVKYPFHWMMLDSYFSLNTFLACTLFSTMTSPPQSYRNCSHVAYISLLSFGVSYGAMWLK
jgi:hypothetical protein